MPETAGDIRSGVVLLPESDIDTDQICPARFMTTTSMAGMADALFHDARRDSAGQLKADHPLNHVDVATHSILVAGPNFGTGSSREHAVWALLQGGFRAVLAPTMGDIFRNNALNNGLLAIEIDSARFDAIAQAPDEKLTISLEDQSISARAIGHVSFRIDPFARLCLTLGLDRLGFLMEAMPQIEHFEERRR